MELDRQVEERKRKNEKQKLLEEQTLMKEEENIKKYFADLESRKKIDGL